MTLRRHGRMACALVLVALLAVSGCATLSEARGSPGQRLDPWENWNRKVFAFNEDLDAAIIKPVATAYSNVVPQLVRRGVDNVFANARDGWSAINNVLQGKPQAAFDDVVRVSTNSVFGFFGILDIASEFGIDHHYEDFGQTLGRWGFGPGAYIVWPLLGPSTVRDSIALPLDRAASPAVLINDGRFQFAIVGLQIVNARANLLGASKVLDEIALDKYTFVRDAYLQRRRSLLKGTDEPAPEGDYAPYEPAAETPGATVRPPPK